MWPGFLAVWVAIMLHFSWIALLCFPHTNAYFSTPVHELWALSGYSVWRTICVLAVVASVATAGMFRRVDAGEKILYLLPQQLVLGVSAAGSVLAIWHSQYADGVDRPGTFIAADQLAVILTWVGHTTALVLLYLIHDGVLTPGGRKVPVDDA